MGTLSTFQAGAYALLGPYEPWMDTANGFRLPGDIGGPMEVDKGYRWNVPVVTYAYDQSFLAFFGANGAAAVDSAMSTLNSLPPASQINPTDYPLITTGHNFAAESQNLADLKSAALHCLLQQMGLASPTRSAFCLRSFSVTDTNLFTIVQRNYDPATDAPSNTVDGTVYVYQYVNYGQTAVIVPYPLDLFTEAYPAVADGGGTLVPEAGNFYTGLTDDDVGGLRHLLSTNIFRFETLLPDVHGAFPNGAQFVNQALRAGVDKVTFTRVTIDALSGQLFAPFTNQYVDVFVSNSIVVTQQLERVVTKPDVIFSAADFTGIPGGVMATGTSNWLNNASLNGNVGGAGPGVIRPPIRIAFQKGIESTVQTGDSQTNNLLSVDQTTWGSFDGTTNLPVSYPQTSGGVNQLNVTLFMTGTNSHTLGNSDGFVWQLPVPMGGAVTLQRSANLKDWYSFYTVTNLGVDLRWLHVCTQPSGFFRVITNGQ